MKKVVMPGRAFLFLLHTTIKDNMNNTFSGNARSGIFVFASPLSTFREKKA